MRPNSFSHSLALTFPLRQSGFTLIELMIAMTLGLLLLASLVYVYTNSAQSFRAQSALTLIQNNARYAFEIMGVDIRQTGFTGTSSTPTNVVVDEVDNDFWKLTDLNNSLTGYESTNPPNVDACTTPVVSSCYRAGTDSLTVVRVDTENKYAVTNHTNTSPFTFTVSPWPTSTPPTLGEIFVAADYTHAAVFQAGSGTSNPNVSYGAGGSPGNSGTNLGVFGGGINVLTLYRLNGTSYYIGTNPAGEPALYRDKLTHSGATLNSTAEELIEGIENMQITYGVDTDADGDVDVYQDAGSVATWDDVLSVRITLTLVSQQGVKVGATGDHLLRKTFTNTIAIRNRLL